jgi:predicted phosphodiesterase
MEKERNPPCRLDSHWEAQWDKVKQINDLMEEYGCDCIMAGDLFEHWKTSPQLLNRCLSDLPGGEFNHHQLRTVIGNHDMPQHNLSNMDKSGFQTLSEAKKISVLKGNHWGFNEEETEIDTLFTTGPQIVIAHMMVWQGKLPWPGCTDPEADEVFDIFPEADLIITGHNHKTFTAEKGKRLLINPGSLTRHKADQVNHKPCVFLWSALTNTFKIHYLKTKKNVISREHIDIKKNKKAREEAFIEKLKNGWDVSLSFKDNLEIAFQKNKVSDKIKQLIYLWYGV